MDQVVKVGDEVFLRNGGGRATVTHASEYGGLYILDTIGAVHRHEFIPVKWMDDKVGNTGIGVCAKNGSGHEG